MVSEFENIKLDEVYELPVRQYLNDLLYIKVERELKEEMEKRIMQKYRMDAKQR